VYTVSGVHDEQLLVYAVGGVHGVHAEQLVVHMMSSLGCDQR